MCNCVNPAVQNEECSGRSEEPKQTYKQRIEKYINGQRKMATQTIVECAEVEALISKLKLTSEDVEKINKFYYGY